MKDERDAMIKQPKNCIGRTPLYKKKKKKRRDNGVDGVSVYVSVLPLCVRVSLQDSTRAHTQAFVIVIFIIFLTFSTFNNIDLIGPPRDKHLFMIKSMHNSTCTQNFSRRYTKTKY